MREVISTCTCNMSTVIVRALIDITQGSILIASVIKMVMILCTKMKIVVVMSSSKIGNSITIILILIITITRMQA